MVAAGARIHGVHAHSVPYSKEQGARLGRRSPDKIGLRWGHSKQDKASSCLFPAVDAGKDGCEAMERQGEMDRLIDGGTSPKGERELTERG